MEKSSTGELNLMTSTFDRLNGGNWTILGTIEEKEEYAQKKGEYFTNVLHSGGELFRRDPSYTSRSRLDVKCPLCH